MSDNLDESEFKIFALLFGAVSILVGSAAYALYRVCHPAKDYAPTLGSFVGRFGVLRNSLALNKEDDVEAQLIQPPHSYAEKYRADSRTAPGGVYLLNQAASPNSVNVTEPRPGTTPKGTKMQSAG